MPRVSVIIPSYNREKFILRALNSVLQQTYRDFDIWVIDDGGSDNTGTLVKEKANSFSDIRINYIHTQNRGVAAARNSGIEKSAGEWIALLDSDDEWRKEKLEKQMDFLNGNPGVSLIHTGEDWIRNGIHVNAPKAYRKYSGDVFERSLPLCMIGPSTVVFKRDLFEEIGGFDEKYPVCEDYDFWLKVTSLHQVGLIDEALTIKYGGHEDQLSTTHVAMDYWRVQSLCRIVQIRDLTPERKNAVLKVIDRKGKVLLNGFLKHGRKDDFKEILSLIHSVDANFSLE